MVQLFYTLLLFMNLSLRKPTDKEFEQICSFIQAFELDNRELKRDEFTVAVSKGKLLGFGRLRHHEECTELCSLGVVVPHRRKGIGKAIVEALIKRASEDIFLVCIIPDFFTPFGFKIVDTFPDAIKNKMNYCTRELIVPESYVAMLYKKSINYIL
jgi:N-acetylglutamate synthase-like GNAT family acetyltransferase